MKPSFPHFVACLSSNSALGGLGLLILPLAVGALAEDGVDAKTLGLIGFLELAGSAGTALLISTRIGRLNPLWLCVIGSVLMAAGNLLTALTVDFIPLLLGLRLVVGVGTGLITVGGLAAIARLRRPDSMYGYIGMAPCFSALLGFALAPQLIELAGAAGVFAFQGALAVLNAFVIFTQRRVLADYIVVENKQAGVEVATDAVLDRAPPTHLDAIAMGFGVGSAFLLAFSDSIVWAFVAPLGGLSGISLAGMSTVLIVSSIIGALGPFAAGRLGDRIGIIAPLLLGQMAMIGLSLLIVVTRDANVFAVALYARVFAILFLQPRYNGVYARVDPTGGLVAAGAGTSGIGYALGPLIGGQIVSIERNEFMSLGLVGAAAAAASLLLSLMLLARRRAFMLQRAAEAAGAT